jgi:hypothetical protein
LAELETYRQRNPKYFPKSVESLLSQWTKTLDQARAFRSAQPSADDKLYDKVIRETNRITGKA